MSVQEILDGFRCDTHCCVVRVDRLTCGAFGGCRVTQFPPNPMYNDPMVVAVVKPTDGSATRLEVHPICDELNPMQAEKARELLARANSAV